MPSKEEKGKTIKVLCSNCEKILVEQNAIEKEPQSEGKAKPQIKVETEREKMRLAQKYAINLKSTIFT